MHCLKTWQFLSASLSFWLNLEPEPIIIWVKWSTKSLILCSVTLHWRKLEHDFGKNLTYHLSFDGQTKSTKLATFHWSDIPLTPNNEPSSFVISASNSAGHSNSSNPIKVNLSSSVLCKWNWILSVSASNWKCSCVALYIVEPLITRFVAFGTSSSNHYFVLWETAKNDVMTSQEMDFHALVSCTSRTFTCNVCEEN